MDKPAGWTSHDVVAVVRRRLGTRAVGHTGTLDPFATGLLLVLTGRATRLARFLAGQRKVYEAAIVFGTATDSDDRTGGVIAAALPERWPDEVTMAARLEAMCGTVMQRPPAVSAKHVGGRRSYELARDGIAVELPPVPVEIHRLELQRWQPPELLIRATVGSGTYVRAIARDLGEAVGIPAHCAELRRTAVGRFAVGDAVAPGEVDTGSLLPAAELVGHLPRQVLDPEQARDIGFGRDVARSVELPVGSHGALVDEAGRLVAVAAAMDGGWHPEVVLEAAA